MTDPPDLPDLPDVPDLPDPPVRPDRPDSPRPAGYPAHWEADVLLADGGTAHLRPVLPDDGPRLLDFWSRL
nr:hypothetical protein [Micromonospora sp. DSM 115978]